MSRERWHARPGRGAVLNRERTDSMRAVIADLISGPDLDGAACTMTDPEVWYPEKGGVGTSRQARAMCRGGTIHGQRVPPCPVRQACLERALDGDDKFTHWGIWAGYTAPKIRRLRRFRAALRRACPPKIEESAA